MALIIKDRVKEGTVTTGTGAFTLGGAASTFEAFNTYMSNGDTAYYAVVHTASGHDEWEVGLGTWNTGNTLTRTTIFSSSNSGNAVSFSSGTKDIFMTYPADRAVIEEPDRSVSFPAGISVTGNIAASGTIDGRDVAADGTKLDGIETAATADQTKSDIDALNIDADTLDGSHASAFATAAQGTTADAALPKAGGTITGDVSFTNGNKAVFGGTGNGELEIYAHATNNNVYISENGGSGNLNLGADNLNVYTNAFTKQVASFTGGSAKLLNDGNEKLATTATGIDVTGNLSFGDNDKALFGDSADFQLYHDSNNSYIHETGTGNLIIRADQFDVKTSDASQYKIRAITNGAVSLYNAGAVKLATTSTGIDVTGNASFANNGKAIFGDSNNLQIFSTGTSSYVAESGSGDLYIKGSSIFLNDTDNNQYIHLSDTGTGGTVVLKHNAVTRLATTSTGIDVTGDVVVSGNVDGRDVAADGTKLDGIETGATADQTKADIEGLGIDVPAANLTGTIDEARLSTATTQVESDDSTKIATTAYVTDKIETLIGGAPGTLNDLNELAAAINDDANYNTTLTTALATKLPLAGGAITGNVTFGDNIKAVFGNSNDLNIRHDPTNGSLFENINSASTVSFRSNGPVMQLWDTQNGGYYIHAARDGAISLAYARQTKFATTSTGISVTGNVTLSGTVDGRDVAADGTKLDGIEAGATGDQTNAEIRAAVEAASNSNVFTDADHSKLNAIEASAKDDQTITAGSGLSGGGTGDVTLSHADTSSVGNSDNSGNTFIQDINFDTYGHVTSVGTGSVSIGNGTLTVQGTGALGGSGTFTANQSGNATISISHDDTSSQASVNGSGRTYIQDVTLDTYGHVTGLATATETVTDTTYSVGDGGLTQKNFTTTLKSKLDGIESGATADQSASQILTAVKTVDGSGSGLDADLLDGQQGSYYYSPANLPAASPATAFATASSNPSSPSNADIYYNTGDHMARMYVNGVWKDMFNLAPTPVGGVISLTVPNSLSYPNFFSQSLTGYFSDTQTASADLAFDTVGTLPPGISISGTNLVHNNLLFSPNSNASTTYTFGITARDLDGATSAAQSISLTLSKPPNPKINYIPNFNVPDITITGTANVSVPSSIADFQLCYVYLVGAGGGGNSVEYSAGWRFGGSGGSARMILCRADLLDGAIVTIPSGKPPSGSWRSTHGDITSIVIGGTTYGTNHSGSNQIIVHPGTYDVSTLSATGFSFSAASNQTNPSASISGTSLTNWGNGLDDGSLQAQGASNTTKTYSGGQGYGTGTGGPAYYETSTYAGNGASGYNQPGQAPGGGGSSFTGSGGNGSCRIYFS